MPLPCEGPIGATGSADHRSERRGTDPSIGTSTKRSPAKILLLVLSVEKVVQHLFVTYAFAVDLGGIRDSVVIHHVPLMVVGSAVGVLFAISARLQFKNERTGYVLLLGLGLFDFISEFFAQGTLAIEVVLSIVVATIILLTLFFARRSLFRA